MSRIAFLSLVFVSTASAAPPLVLEAQYPGASPQVVADTVAAPLEQQLRGVEGVRKVSSLCTFGRCLIWLDLTAKADRGKVRTLVQNSVALARPMLPEERRGFGITLFPDMDDTFEVLVLRPTAGTDLNALSVLARDVIQPRLGRVLFVSGVTIVGGETGS